MKWLALVLVVLNLGIWQLSVYAKVGARPGSVVSGSLPRVASLKIQGEPASTPQTAPSEPVCVRLGWVESLEGAEALKAHPAFAGASSLLLEEVERSLPSLH